MNSPTTRKRQKSGNFGVSHVVRESGGRRNERSQSKKKEIQIIKDKIQKLKKEIRFGEEYQNAGYEDY